MEVRTEHARTQTAGRTWLSFFFAERHVASRKVPSCGILAARYAVSVLDTVKQEQREIGIDTCVRSQCLSSRTDTLATKSHAPTALKLESACRRCCLLSQVVGHEEARSRRRE
eukprot:168311-Rhodomonas_salina.3